MIDVKHTHPTEWADKKGNRFCGMIWKESKSLIQHGIIRGVYNAYIEEATYKNAQKHGLLRRVFAG